MKTSFVIIAYNEERNLGATLESIFALDGLRDFEVIVVNDGSRDGTLALARDFGKKHPELRIVDLQPNRGRGGARAAGLSTTKGDYIAFVDADILLPTDWLTRCIAYMKDFDACGGIAVPDGDVAWVHRIFKLTPKVAAHTTTVSGGNGLFKRRVFDKVSFNPEKRNGEDVDLGYQIQAHGLKTTSIPDLLVEHHETKTYLESLRWLAQSGRGATRQLYEHGEVRLPDLAFFGFVGLTIAAIVAAFFVSALWWVLLAAAVLSYVFLSSAMHLYTKFALPATPLYSLAGIVANMSLLTSYYLGRAVGLVTEKRRRA